MRVYRISAEVHARDAASAFSGLGGMYGLGRWHTTGRRIVYCAQNLSLSALESLVHLKRADKVQPYVHYVAEVPDASIQIVGPLPSHWNADLRVTQAVGDGWLASKASPVLRVPSIIVTGEYNYLLNPEHPQFSLGWVTVGPMAFKFDGRLTQP